MRSGRPGKEDPDGEIENSGKSIFEIRIPNFSYIQVIVFDLSYPPVTSFPGIFNFTVGILPGKPVWRDFRETYIKPVSVPQTNSPKVQISKL